MPAFIDITGKRFGRLTALEALEGTPQGVRWRCICDCGRPVITPSRPLRDGRTKSCGCLTRYKPIPNRRTRAYKSWQQAQDRCNNPRHHAFHLYGGRGIEFRFTDFDVFFALLGERPPGHELDRIDVNGHYERGNVRWWPRGKGARRSKHARIGK